MNREKTEKKTGSCRWYVLKIFKNILKDTDVIVNQISFFFLNIIWFTCKIRMIDQNLKSKDVRKIQYHEFITILPTAFVYMA